MKKDLLYEKYDDEFFLNMDEIRNVLDKLDEYYYEHRFHECDTDIRELNSNIGYFQILLDRIKKELDN